MVLRLGEQREQREVFAIDVLAATEREIELGKLGRGDHVLQLGVSRSKGLGHDSDAQSPRSL
jgi:hypothetical protein